MAKIFISYRREDSAYATGVIRDQLASQLPGCEIFFDVDSIPYGVDFRKHLEGCVSACDFLVAVIGKRWVSAADSQGNRRLENPDDAVRVEVETALRRNIPLIPVFLDGMDVPTPNQLPDALRDLVSRNGIFVRPPPDFNHDVSKLVQSVQQWIHQGEPVPQPPKHSPATAVATRLRAVPRKWFAAAVLLALTGGGLWSLNQTQVPIEYEIAETYLFEDDNPAPAVGKPHSRMLGEGLKMPVQYVHWVVLLKHAKKIPHTEMLIECRVLEDGNEVGKMTGLVGELPDENEPGSGQSEWILTFGTRWPMWKPGKYTLQMSTPTKTASTNFEIFPE